MAKFFIRRPIFAWVIAITIMLAGLLAIFTLSISQYPDIAPTMSVDGSDRLLSPASARQCALV